MEMKQYIFLAVLCIGVSSINNSSTTIDNSSTGLTTSEDVTTSFDTTSSSSNITTTSNPSNVTTTTTPETTTTSTTTPKPTTPKPTTPKPTTPAPAPKPTVNYFYNISNTDGVQCIMIDGKFSFKITYSIGNNKTNVTTLLVPAPSPSVNVTGSCGEKLLDDQFIQIMWAEGVSSNNIRITFSASNNSKDWFISKFTSEIYMDANDFINATQAGNSLMSTIPMLLTPNQVPMNHSFMCYASLTFSNFSTAINGHSYSFPVELDIDGVQIQAFNRKKTKDKFVEEIHCEADKIADVVPIAVGCALAVLVLIVLVAYIVGRRRQVGSYQSV